MESLEDEKRKLGKQLCLTERALTLQKEANVELQNEHKNLKVKVSKYCKPLARSLIAYIFLISLLPLYKFQYLKELNKLTSDTTEVKDDNERLRLQGFLHCIAQDAIDDIDEDNFEDNVEMHFPSSLLKKAKSELFSSTPNLDESAIRYLIPLDNFISPALTPMLPSF